MLSDKSAMPKGFASAEKDRRAIHEKIASLRKTNNSSVELRTEPKTSETRRPYTGHEALIDALRNNASRVSFVMTNGNRHEGKITHFDRETITIRDTLPDAPAIILFKSNISEMTPEPLHYVKDEK